jgi:hypothetical protein
MLHHGPAAYRAHHLATACRAAQLDDYDSGYVAGVMSLHNHLPAARYRELLEQTINDVVLTEDVLRDAGVDPDDPAALANHADSGRVVLQ